MTFKATLADVSLFKDAIGAISELISEGVFKIRKDGIYFSAVDHTMVAMVDLKLFASNFENYEVEGDQEVAVNLGEVIQVIKRAKASDKVVIELQKQANKLHITLLGSSTRKFVIPLLDIEKADTPSMNLDFPATVEVNSSVLTESIQDASLVDDAVTFNVTKDHFIIQAAGDLSQVEVKLDKGSQDIYGMDIKADSKSKYSLDYLKKIDKASKLADSVKIQFGKDYPIKVTYKTPEKAEVSYILAPRVED